MSNYLFAFSAQVRGVPQRISFHLPVESGVVITNQYRPDIIPLSSSIVGLQAGEAIFEFQNDCENIINVAGNSTNSGIDAFVDGLLDVVKSHINRCGRLIFGDLMIYVDCFAHIIKAIGLPENEVKQCYLIELAIITKGFLPYIKDEVTLAPFSQTTLYDALMQHVNELSIKLTGRPFGR